MCVATGMCGKYVVVFLSFLLTIFQGIHATGKALARLHSFFDIRKYFSFWLPMLDAW